MAGVDVMAGVSVAVGAGDSVTVGVKAGGTVAAGVGVSVSGKGVVVSKSGVALGGDVSVGATLMSTFENKLQPNSIRLKTSRKGMIFGVDMESTPWLSLCSSFEYLPYCTL